jgi:hypothetical protein
VLCLPWDIYFHFKFVLGIFSSAAVHCYRV